MKYKMSYLDHTFKVTMQISVSGYGMSLFYGENSC